MASRKISTVIVVDDNDMLRECIGNILRRAGYNVVAAANAEEALGCLETETVEAVVSDFEMPGMNGLELLKHVKEVKPDIPFFLMTGFARFDGSSAIEKGATGVLLKPFQDAELLTALQALESAV